MNELVYHFIPEASKLPPGSTSQGSNWHFMN